MIYFPAPNSNDFERELGILGTEGEAAAQFFYAFMSVHETARRCPSVVRLLNTAALFWNTSLGALQTATFIALGRLFDQNSPHNLDRILKVAGENMEIFSLQALGARKQGQSPIRPAWLDDYLVKAYVPSPTDFRKLRKEVNERRKIYIDKYGAIRNKVYAHKTTNDFSEEEALFSGTGIQELQLLVTFILALHEALWQLYHNGRAPVLQQQRYSVVEMLDHPTQNGPDPTVQERITHEAARFLRNISQIH